MNRPTTASRFRNEGTAVWVRAVGLLFAGLFAGFLVAVLVLEMSLRDSGGEVYTQVRQVELDSLDKLAVVTLVPALVTAALLVVLGARTRGRDFWLTSIALALLVGVFVLTLTVNMPINADQLDWHPQSPPDDWADVRDRWQIAHAIRTVAGVLAFGTLVVARSTQRAGKVPDPLVHGAGTG
ncbi:DUF1772 domain-containing protein [Embleya scabrispora]|uniref:DUF1772 domain-containing protein n=1 Tax=Embleya scabrispora TaxID=159449 RepID=UPI00037BFBE4|nr:DUF1772 domain-containing protein [Embleya scabrispora]MYS84630.1 DUF1772 domain-containing protein [Streptomyces sp. SID5474]